MKRNFCRNLSLRKLLTPIVATVTSAMTATSNESTIIRVSAITTVATFWNKRRKLSRCLFKNVYSNCQRWNLLHDKRKPHEYLISSIKNTRGYHRRGLCSSYQYETIKIIKQINDWMKIQLKYFIYHRCRHRPDIQLEHRQ